MTGLLLGCDVGSQGLKAVLLDPGRGVVAEAYRGYPLAYPKPGWAEQDPWAWQAALREAVAEVLTAAGAVGGDVTALGFGSQVDGLVACDRQLRPIRPAIVWMDRRAAEQCQAIAELLPEDQVFDVTGLNLDPSHVAPKILWLRDTEPWTYTQSAHLLLPGGFVVAWLTGELVVDYSNASSSMLLDVRERAWSAEITGALGVDPVRLGAVAPATEVAGGLARRPAQELGLPVGLPVAVGCGDEHAACVGAGVLGPGVVCDIAGTAEPVAAAAEEPVFDTTRLIETHCHADPRYWLIENPGFVAGGSLRWLRDLLGVDDYEELATEAHGVQPGADGLWFLPCLSGAMTPAWDPDARGVFFGLALSHGRRHLVRAVLEGCAYGLKDLVDRIEALGFPATEIRSVAGGARSEVWCQIKADVTGRRVVVPEVTETTALGAAMIAGVAAGEWKLDEAVAAHVRTARMYEPDAAATERYRDGYEIYRRLFDAVTPLFRSPITP